MVCIDELEIPLDNFLGHDDDTGTMRELPVLQSIDVDDEKHGDDEHVADTGGAQEQPDGGGIPQKKTFLIL